MTLQQRGHVQLEDSSSISITRLRLMLRMQTYDYGWYGAPPEYIPPEGFIGTWISMYARVSGSFHQRLILYEFPQDKQNVTSASRSCALEILCWFCIHHASHPSTLSVLRSA